MNAYDSVFLCQSLYTGEGMEKPASERPVWNPNAFFGLHCKNKWRKKEKEKEKNRRKETGVDFTDRRIEKMEKKKKVHTVYDLTEELW